MAPTAVNLLLAENLGSSGGSYGTTAFSVTPGRLVIGCVFVKVASPSVPDTTFCSHAGISGDFTQVGPSIALGSIASPLVRGTIWKGIAHTSGSFQAFVGLPTASTDVCHVFFEIVGTNLARPDWGVVQVASGVADTGTALATSTLATFTGGGVTVAVFYSASSGAVTPEAGWTGLTGANGAGSSIRAAYKLSADTTPTATEATSAAWGAFGLEITDTAPTATTYEQAVFTDNPVGYWRLNDSSTAAVDSSGHGNTGTYHSPVGGTHDSSSPITNTTTPGSYHYASGDATWLTVPSTTINFGGNTYSVEMWAKNVGTPANFLYLFCMNTDNAANGGLQGYALYTAGAGSIAFLVNEVGPVTALSGLASSPWDGNWHHIVGIYDGVTAQSVYVYVDGVLASANVGPFTGSTQGMPHNGGPYDALISGFGTTGGGNTVTGTTLGFVGYFAEVAVYDYPLSPTRINAHYAARVVSVPGPTELHLRTSRLVY